MRDQSILGVQTWRMERGITLENISEATNLGVRTLKAIEAGDFKSLPGGIYNTNYIRQYARAIGYSEPDLLAYYHGAINQPVPALVVQYS